jgi:actin-related protein
VGGVIRNIDSIKKILAHLMNNELRVAPEDHKILLTEPPNNPKKNREELIDLMFQEFRCPKLYLGNQSVLSLFATGRTTGTVLDAGEGITHTVPIYEGYAIPHAIEEIPLSGRDLTAYLYEMLNKRDSTLIGATTNDLEIVKSIKETMCIVA